MELGTEQRRSTGPAAEKEDGSGAERSPSGAAQWVRAAHSVLLPWAHRTPQQKGWAAKQPRSGGCPVSSRAREGVWPRPHFSNLLPQNRVAAEHSIVRAAGPEETGRGRTCPRPPLCSPGPSLAGRRSWTPQLDAPAPSTGGRRDPLGAHHLLGTRGLRSHLRAGGSTAAPLDRTNSAPGPLQSLWWRRHNSLLGAAPGGGLLRQHCRPRSATNHQDTKWLVSCRQRAGDRNPVSAAGLDCRVCSTSGAPPAARLQHPPAP